MAEFFDSIITAWKQPRWRYALIAAILSDLLSFGLVLVPPVQWLLDGVTAVLLFAILGFRWPLLTGLVFEAVPGLQVFPAWTLVVSALAVIDAKQLNNSNSGK